MTAAPAGLRTMSFEALYDAHVDDVWRAVRRLGIDGATVDDVVQDAFVTAWRSLDSFQGKSQLKTWLIGIAFNHARHALRSQRVRSSSELDEELPSLQRAPDDRAVDQQHHELLLEMLRALPEEQREVFVMMDLEGFSAPEVAGLVGAPVNTVYSRLRLARAAIDAAVARLEARDV